MAFDELSSSDEPERGTIAGTTALSLDTVFEILASKRRRFVVYALLKASPGILAFEDLVTAVTKSESDDASDRGDDLQKAIVTDLHHWHLPVLEDIGIISYDERSNVIQYYGDPLLETWAEWAAKDEFEDHFPRE